MKDIRSFHIGTAFYILENKNGSKLKLILNYAKNTFKFTVLNDFGRIDRLKKQAEIVAQNLLGKKAKRNLAYKLLKLK